MYASLAVNSTQMLPAMPVKITRRMRSVSSKRVQGRVKKTGVLRLEHEVVAIGRDAGAETTRPGDDFALQCATVFRNRTATARSCR